MRVKEAIHKVVSHPMYSEWDKLLKTTKEEFFSKKLNSKFYCYGIHDPAYARTAFYWKEDNIKRQIPHFHKKIEMQYGHFEVTAYIYIGPEDHARTEAVCRKYLNFECERLYSLFWNMKWELPLDLNLDNPIPQLKKILRKVIYPEGLFNAIQFKYGCDKERAIFHYKHIPMYFSINEDKIFKWIEKHFNVESFLSLNDTIEWVNKHGKQDTLKKLMKFDYSFMWDFDGDIDEAEEVFWEEMENYPENAVLI